MFSKECTLEEGVNINALAPRSPKAREKSFTSILVTIKIYDDIHGATIRTELQIYTAQ
jgi:hypothetical protein